jgi:CMP-N-acetylneuraminic acid synthetase
VPFVRPACLATDEATSSDVVLHALKALEERYDYFVLLQPTSPFRTFEDIDTAIALCIDSQAPSVVSVREVRERPEWMCALNKEGNLIFPFPSLEDTTSPLYILNGAVYVVHIGEFLKTHLFFKSSETRVFPMSWERSIDIDTQEDWLLAEFVLRNSLAK